MSERKLEERGCPDCFEGTIWEPCSACGGNGCDPAGTEKDCPKCEGAGEQPMRGCTTCNSAGTVSYSLMRLTEADRWVRANAPEWDGCNESHNGVTLFSMAEWFRRRRGFAAETVEAGLIDDDVVLRVGGADVIKPGDTVLHRRVIEFTGFAWGYGGEGPHGLAALLADAFSDDFPTFDLAFAFVVRQPFGAGWMFRAGDGRNGDVLRKQVQDLGESGLHDSLSQTP